MRTREKFILILPVLLVFMAMLAVPQQADAAVVKKLAFSMKQVYVETGKGGSLDSIGLRVLATLDNGLEQDVTDQCTLSSAKESIFTVSGQTVTAKAKGSAALKAAYGGKTASLSVKVIDPVKPELCLSADSITIQNGKNLSVKATLEYTDERLKPLDVTGYCTWSSDDEDIVSVKTGKLKALGSSPDDIGIQAQCTLLGGSLSGSLTVKVITPIKSLTTRPFSLSGSVGGTFAPLEIIPVYTDGSTGNNVSPDAQFSSTNIKVATVDGSGVISYVGAGRASIKGAYAGKTVSIPVQVIDGSVTLTMVPDVTELQIEAGKSSSIKFKDNNGKYVTPYVNLASNETSVATTSSGRITAVAPGQAEITCTYGGVTKTFQVAVIKKVSSLSASPGSINIDADQTAQIILTATYSDKTTGQVTGTYTSGNSDIAAVDATGTVSGGTEAGNTKITASFGGKTVTIPVNVIASGFDGITFSTGKASQGPTSPAGIIYNLATSNSLKMYAQALFSGSHSNPVTDITGQCVWTSDDTTVATVSDGTVTAKKAGATRITATYGSRSNSFTVNVWPTISGFTVAPSALGFFGPADTPQPISSIIAEFSDGSERDLLPSEISWASKNESLVTVDSDGAVSLAPSQATSFKTGSTTVTGTFAGKTFTVAVTVSPEITDFDPSTSSITLITGTAATFKVTAQYDGGTYSDVTKICDYVAKDGGGTITPKVIIDKDKGTITAQAGAPESGTIEVTLNGTTKPMTYTVIPKPSALGMELVPNEGTVFNENNLVVNNGTLYFNIVNEDEIFNLYAHSTSDPTADSSRISGGSLLSVFSSNNSVATVNWDNGQSVYKLARAGGNGTTAVITAYFLDKSFKFTVGVDLINPATPEQIGTIDSIQSGDFNIIVSAEKGSSVSAAVYGSNVLSGTATSVTATTAGKATLPIAIAKLAEGVNAIDIIATDPAGNPSDTYTVNIIGDTTEPVITSVTASQINGGGDTIVVQFDEALENGSNQVTNKANWTIKYADDTSDSHITDIKTTKADFNYDEASKTLTIKLDEAADQAFLPSGKYVKVTPSSTNIKDKYGNAGAVPAYTVATVTADDTTGPSVSTDWAKTDARHFTITYDEVLDSSAATDEDNWTFNDDSDGGTAISSVSLDPDGKTVTVTLNGDIEPGDTLEPSADIKDLAGNSVDITIYTEAP